MMIGPVADAQVMVATRSVDFRKGPATLAALAEAEHAKDSAGRTPAERPRKANRGSLPAHLELIERIVDPEEVEAFVSPICSADECTELDKVGRNA